VPYIPFRGLGGAQSNYLNSRGRLRFVAFGEGTTPYPAIACPGNTLWLPYAITFTATVPAASANPAFILLDFKDPSGTTYLVAATQTDIQAGTSAIVSFGTFNSTALFFGATITGGFMGLFNYLLPGCSIVIDFNFATAAPTISPGLMLVEEWILS
jgi:hypothetical protein